MSEKEQKKVRLSPLILRYQSAYKENPTSLVFAPLAEGYRKLGLVDEALKILKDGLRNHPGYIMGHLSMASCYYDLEKYELAYHVVSPLAGQNLDNILLQKLVLEICLKLHLNDEALKTSKYLLYLNPKDEKLKKIVSSFEIDTKNSSISPSDEIVLEDDEDNWKQVSFNSNEIVEEDDEQEELEKEHEVKESFVSHTLVDLYLKQGLVEKAKEVLEKILEANPNDHNTKDKLAHVKKQIDHKFDNSVEEEDGGNRLMQLYDQKVNTECRVYSQIESCFSQYLELIKDKAKEVIF